MRALVTGAGAAGGIGLACARALAAAGHEILIAGASGRIHARAAELQAEGIVVTAFQGDLTDPAVVDRLADLGPVDILVNNAGMGMQGAPQKIRAFAVSDPETWRREFDLSLTTAVLVTRAFLPGMIARGFGRVVMMASVTGPLVSVTGSSAYSAAKAAMVGLTHTLALEVAKDGVTVNAVAPGWIATEATQRGEFAAARKSPMGRAGTPEEVAACVSFLASRGASYVNGVTLVVDGGNLLQEKKG
ncbi:SDR family NAD(P)-dependent oxidoreductase [Gemmobacter serpentinus]|uniref:SDR family NAD(P)-dependent oxidoreductase n=1 Tax=Gemmobacter serpentinus TaxID=2652247 RepID=UPI00124E800B|nr:SDR family oxidoreductase [Gemmobacter serpentinus]